jgi:hypothetical protein
MKIAATDNYDIGYTKTLRAMVKRRSSYARRSASRSAGAIHEESKDFTLE